MLRGADCVFRNGDGGITAIYDRCAHRRMPLSHGVVGPEGVTCASQKLMARHYASTGVDVRVSCDSEPAGVGGVIARNAGV
jgi:nitrite reductase/ring-hydroxylating ferredoxin subunit